MDRHSVAVVIPAYNPDEKLVSLVEDLKQRFDRILEARRAFRQDCTQELRPPRCVYP